MFAFLGGLLEKSLKSTLKACLAWLTLSGIKTYQEASRSNDQN
jgi:hypothetical protein